MARPPVLEGYRTDKGQWKPHQNRLQWHPPARPPMRDDPSTVLDTEIDLAGGPDTYDKTAICSKGSIST